MKRPVPWLPGNGFRWVVHLYNGRQEGYEALLAFRFLWRWYLLKYRFFYTGLLRNLGRLMIG